MIPGILNTIYPGQKKRVWLAHLFEAKLYLLKKKNIDRAWKETNDHLKKSYLGTHDFLQTN